MAALASFGHSPWAVDNNILTKTYNTSGVFAMKVRVAGVVKTIVVDDFIAFNTSTTAADTPMYGAAS